ncbi:hypothetical protein B0T16DRAFT_173807 [Cercophora newfieldiana]|uniref:Secreted protein n=1 Tax=Cercophora newfieldiana TaxID=92897 RepID=A0AA40CMX6_9PEZI|nr:hypothetical protein B0T16DRAFT_173807 [Cercophora newfieldiana]
MPFHSLDFLVFFPFLQLPLALSGPTIDLLKAASNSAIHFEAAAGRSSRRVDDSRVWLMGALGSSSHSSNGEVSSSEEVVVCGAMCWTFMVSDVGCCEAVKHSEKTMMWMWMCGMWPLVDSSWPED